MPTRNDKTPHLVLLEPFLQQLLPALSENGPSEFKGLVFVQLALFQQNAKVLQNRGKSTRLHWNLLELVDGRWCAKDTLV